MGGKLDLYRLFAERAVRLVAIDGAIGLLLPSAFHANEGATGIRQLYLRDTSIDWCLSFENRRKLFDIHSRIKFDLLIARRPGPTRDIRCAFYLSEFAQLEQSAGFMVYDAGFIKASGGPSATLLELRGVEDLTLARRMFSGGGRFGTWLESLGVVISRELHMTDDANRFTTISAGSPGKQPAGRSLMVHEGKTIHQFLDSWTTTPRYTVAIDRLVDKPRTLDAVKHYRAACREVARSTDERTAIATMLPPGVICGHTISVERRPRQRPNAAALAVVAVMNTFPFDWLLRQKAAAHVSLYILAELPMAKLSPAATTLLAHGALRLCCNHAGFATLWAEQLGDCWREIGADRNWPALPDETARWQLRAAMDAIVAHAYALTRKQYQRVLRSFSHKSFPEAPIRCLTAFDELIRNGLVAFSRDNDPYCDIAPVTSAARPAFDLPVAAPNQPSLCVAELGACHA